MSWCPQRPVLQCSSILPMLPKPRYVERRGSGCSRLGLQIQVLNAGTSREIDAAFETFARSGLTPFVGSDPFFPAGGCNSPTWRRTTRSLRYMRP